MVLEGRVPRALIRSETQGIICHLTGRAATEFAIPSSVNPETPDCYPFSPGEKVRMRADVKTDPAANVEEPVLLRYFVSLLFN
jgi:hypothetical protein